MNGFLVVTVLFLGMFLGAVLSAPLHNMAYQVSHMANGPDEEFEEDEAFRPSLYRN